MSSDPHHLLRIYVRDHHTASAGGAALSRRAADNNEHTEFESDLRWLADAIAGDQRSLEDVMVWLAVSPSPTRLAVARVGELVARLKANGRIVGYSPSSRIVELEALTAGVSAKRQLWRALHAVAEGDSTFADPVAASQLVALQRAATEQLDVIDALHRRAVQSAFVQPSSAGETERRPHFGIGSPQDWPWREWVSAARGRFSTTPDTGGDDTMATRTTSPSIKDPDQYDALRDQGMSKEKAARIANASARDGRSAVAARGGHAEDYDERTKAELLDRARDVGIEGRSKMTKRELIDALRNH